MAVDKLVDSTQLDTDLTSVANAIRAKSGGSSQLAFPAGFVSEIGNIENVYYSSFNGTAYAKKHKPPEKSYGQAFPALRSCSELESVELHDTSTTGQGSGQYKWAYNSKLKTFILDQKLNSMVNNNREFQSDTALQSVQLGGINHPVAGMTNGNIFAGCTQQGLTITIYVADSTTIPFSASPWGATNATIIYRSSTDGSVRTP